MDNIHKYFYIICFAGYMREAAAAARESIEADKKADVALPASGKCSIPAKDLKLPSSFVDFMTKNDSLRAVPTRTSRATLVRLSMISTRLLTRCSLTCHRVTTRREPSTGLPQRLS